MISKPNQSQLLTQALQRAAQLASSRFSSQMITPEHLLMAICEQAPFASVVPGADEAGQVLADYIERHIPTAADSQAGIEPELSQHFIQVLEQALQQLITSDAKQLDVPHVLSAMFSLPSSAAARQVLDQLAAGDEGEMMMLVVTAYDTGGDDDGGIGHGSHASPEPQQQEPEPEPANGSQPGGWRQWVTCLNDMVQHHNPLIGREAELDRTIEVLCRRDKNNPMHVGDAGVGKTALAYGLAARIQAGQVPQRLQGSHIYSLDLGGLLAGTQFRGDLEKRLKSVLGGVEPEGNAILYVDEAHLLVGAGRTEGGSIDISNLLKPYLERGSMRFMGATTHEEFNRHIARNKAFARRFEKIDIEEPSTHDCQLILEGLKQGYEEFHHVRYTPQAISYAVTASAKYITNRRLPDKAIDLIDQAGAWVTAHTSPLPGGEPAVVDRDLIARVLATTCNVDILAQEKSHTARLKTLDTSLRKRVFGQDQAIAQVTEAVLMGSAGLLAEGKPMASLLFVGPTGVGKTEVARVLAQELGVPLVRFDMSEYAEKHSVAKLIGAPAGYVGYDDGGLLTDAVRRSPRCVLLLDELEKAHSDIYNILLQVMDYATLSDSKGQKADFRHVVIIMTTNAGAQWAKSGTGFVRTATAGQAMMKSVRATFKPEFLNRLTAVTTFNDVDRDMAAKILDKKLGELRQLLDAKQVKLRLTAAARAQLMAEGFSPEYGGREIERVIAQRLKPLLTRAILFGPLQHGGTATVTYNRQQQFAIK